MKMIKRIRQVPDIGRDIRYDGLLVPLHAHPGNKHDITQCQGAAREVRDVDLTLQPADTLAFAVRSCTAIE